MSGIVGGINLRSSGLVNSSSATDGQVLTGTGVGLPAGFEAAGGGGFTAGTAVTPTGGTVTFGSIPTGTKQIIVNFDSISIDVAEMIKFRIGDAGGVEYSGYHGRIFQANASHNAEDFSHSWVLGHPDSSADYVYSGSLFLQLLNASTYTWSASGLLGANPGGHVTIIGGAKSLSAELTQVALIADGGNFDAGSMNILYQ